MSSASCDSNFGWFLAFLIQSAFIAGECWFLCIAIDPVLSIARPFLSAKGKRRTYMVLVNTVACIFGICLLNRASGKHGIGDSETFNRICWIANGKGMGIKYFVYIPVAFVMGVAMVLMFVVWRSLHVGLARTLLTRKRVVTNSLAFIAV